MFDHSRLRAGQHVRFEYRDRSKATGVRGQIMSVESEDVIVRSDKTRKYVRVRFENIADVEVLPTRIDPAEPDWSKRIALGVVAALVIVLVAVVGGRPATPRLAEAPASAPSQAASPTPSLRPTPTLPTATLPTAIPTNTQTPVPTAVGEFVFADLLYAASEDEVLRGAAGEYHWTDVDVQEVRFRVRWSATAPPDHACKFRAWFDSHPDTRFLAAPEAGERATANKGVSAVSQGGLTVRTDCITWKLTIVGPTYDNNDYWYCWDTGAPRPHHLGYPVDNDHWCTDEELRQSGY